MKIRIVRWSYKDQPSQLLLDVDMKNTLDSIVVLGSVASLYGSGNLVISPHNTITLEVDDILHTLKVRIVERQ